MIGKTKKIAIVGTQGVPAHYGGFETLVENLISDTDPNIQYTVFCSTPDLPTHIETYKGATLKYVSLRSNGIQSTLYDLISMLKARKGFDDILVLGVSGCAFLPLIKLLTSARLIVNIDGLEHRRAKWNKYAKWFLRFSEHMAVKFGDTIIADNKGIADYVMDTYKLQPEVIAYGGNHVLTEVSDEEQDALLSRYDLRKKEYALTICRIEPENNIDITLETFAETGDKLVIVGNFHNSNYSLDLLHKYSCYSNIIMINSLYDKVPLYILRANSRCYIHGHSAGGTNPSLVEAMFFGRPILAFDVNYNRETTLNKAQYFSNKEDLKKLIANIQQCDGKVLQQIASEKYTWQIISKQYKQLY